MIPIIRGAREPADKGHGVEHGIAWHARKRRRSHIVVADLFVEQTPTCLPQGERGAVEIFEAVVTQKRRDRTAPGPPERTNKVELNQSRLP